MQPQNALDTAWHSKPRAKPVAENPELLNAKQVANLFGIGTRKFATVRDEPWMPKPIVIGPRCLRWLRAEILEAVAEKATRVQKFDEPPQLKSSKPTKTGG